MTPARTSQRVIWSPRPMSPVPPVAAIRETSGTILDPPGTCLCNRHSESDVCRHSGPVPVMNTSPRRLALSIGIALSALAAGACGDDAAPAEVADALAQDSTLELAIYGAFPDSAPSPAVSADSALANDRDAAGPALPRSRSDTATPSRSANSTATTQRTAARDDEARPTVVAQRAPSRVNATGARQATTNRATRRSRESARTTRRESLQLANTRGREIDFPTKRMGGTALVPAGTSLSLAAAKQICTATSQVGDRFSLRVAEGLVGPLGTVIPAGSTATGEIASLSEPGDDVRMGVRIAAVEISGRTYPLESELATPKLARIRTQGGDPRYTGCVRKGARITTQLSSPLRIRVME